MNITIKAHHVNITGALKDYANKKVEKLLKFFDNVQDVTIELDIRDASDEDSRQFVAGIIHASQTIIRAEESSRDMYASIDLVCEKLGVQLKKHKEKLRDHNRKAGAKAINIEPGDKNDIAPELDADNLYIPKPMTVDEAVELLEERELPFLMFRNIRTEEINVVYPIGSSKIGHLEP